MIFRTALAISLLMLLVLKAPAWGQLAVVTGPTPIPRGNAVADRDITVSNAYFAVAFAVETAPPWGVARGGIVDIATVTDGTIGHDFASLADFMPNRWSSWPTSYQRVSIDRQTDTEVVVRTVRDWGNVELDTRFTIRADSNKIHMLTHMSNKGDTIVAGSYSGYVVWPEGGSLFGVPGLYGADMADERDALADWSAAYDEHWMLGLYAPFSEIVAYDGRDRYRQHDLSPGETHDFEAWLLIGNDGSLSPLVETEIEFRRLPFGNIAGTVSSNSGAPVERPAVVVMLQDAPYAWTIGNDSRYQLKLPVGEYRIYATAQGYAPGDMRTVSVTQGSETRLDFDDLQPPGAVQFEVADAASGAMLDARIDIRDGPRSLIGFYGKNTLFTELHEVGTVSADMLPGDYVFEVSAAGGFTSQPQLLTVQIVSGKTARLKAVVPVLANPRAAGWYSADLHHHSDVLDGFTEAEFVLRSELAAGVDISFLSDHDSVINNQPMRVLSASRGVQFMPGTEMSPSWAHFNAYPVDDGKTIDIDTGRSTVQEIFAAARRMGADIVEANHPYNAYGYFTALESEAVPGGYDAGFDLVEIVISSGNDQNVKTLQRAWGMWNAGKPAYLAGGSDVHDVWLERSGSSRTFAYVPDGLTVDKFVAAIKAGNSYASQGPLVYPDLMFGSTVKVNAGEEIALGYNVQAVSGLRSVQLIERGEQIDVQLFDGANALQRVAFTVHPATDTWYSLSIEDEQGKFAFTNPLWVRLSN